MQLAFFNALERMSKVEIANEIKARETVSHCDINWVVATFFDKLQQAIDEGFCVFLEI